jgi:hypothetical protein
MVIVYGTSKRRPAAVFVREIASDQLHPMAFHYSMDMCAFYEFPLDGLSGPTRSIWMWGEAAPKVGDRLRQKLNIWRYRSPKFILVPCYVMCIAVLIG